MTIKTTIILSAIAAFFISVALGPVVIPILRRVKAGQTEREDGPQSHLVKTGTPTMGGFIFLISFVLCAGFFCFKYTELLPIVLLTVAFAVVGFIDDFIKVVLKRSEGLTVKQKLLLQIIVAAVYSILMFFLENKQFSVYIPFVNNTFNIGWLGVPILMFIIIGTVNGSNFTDGVDGLETSVTAALCAFFFAVSIGKNEGYSIAAVIMFGALLGFLVYNLNKARVFMGDTGSLALGGFVAAFAHALKLELYIPIIALIYFAEVISVIIQVLYFKKTGGKRFFRMAPLHHHFELGGWKDKEKWAEAKVVGVFTIVTVLLCAVAYIFV